MCVTFKPAVLSSTTILTGTIPGSTTRYLHYRNTAAPKKQDKPTFRTSRSLSEPLLPAAWDFSNNAGAYAGFTNALAFPIFGKFETINSIDASAAPSAMDAINQAIDSLYPQSRELSFGMTMRGKGIDSVRVLVTKLYTVIVAKEASMIIDELKAGGASPELFNEVIAAQFQQAYTSVAPFAVCLFKDDAVKQGGLLLTFEPLEGFESVYFIPTLDGHGKLDFAEHVAVDHVIAVGTAHEDGATVYYGSRGSDELSVCLPERVLGVRLSKGMYLPNGDIVIDKASADAGVFKARRVAPFGLTADQSPLVSAPMTIEAPHWLDD